LNSKTKYAGQLIDIIYEKDYPIAFSKEIEEFTFFLEELNEMDLISFKDIGGGGQCKILYKGWEKIEKLKRINIASIQCFVAMSFKEDMDRIYENAISKAILDTGYSPYRIDKEEHADLIPYKMLAEIRKSKFTIADFTYQPGGVYFEAGFAMGLNQIVIWICKEEDFDKAHFNIKQYNHIIYKDEKELYDKLKARIEGIITQNDRCP
jgi:hypothetical protein